MVYYNENDPKLMQPDDGSDSRNDRRREEPAPAGPVPLRVRVRAESACDESPSGPRDAVRVLRQGGSGEARRGEAKAAGTRTNAPGPVVCLQGKREIPRGAGVAFFSRSGVAAVPAMRLLRRRRRGNRPDRLVSRLRRRQRLTVLCDVQLRQARHAARVVSRVGETSP